MSIDELNRILLSNKPSEELLNKEEELFKLIPQLKICKGFEQRSDWHIYDVYEHILHVVDNVPSNLVLRLAALFHDIGKPLSYKEDENGVAHFYGHWEVSQKIFEKFAKEHNYDETFTKIVSNLIYYHDINLEKIDDDKMYMVYNTFKAGGLRLLYQLKKADLLAQNKRYHYILEDYSTQKEKILNKYQKNNYYKNL